MVDRELISYRQSDSIVFFKTAETFGGLSNMAGGYPLTVNGVKVRTSEALYQACRFPHIPRVQELILVQHSPMTAKMKSKPYRHESRSDWDDVREVVMWWCLRVKLVQNWSRFAELLNATGDLPIVEFSRRDDFWGAKPYPDNILVGRNVLGRMLTALRDNYTLPSREVPVVVQPPTIEHFLLLGSPIREAVASSSQLEAPLLSHESHFSAPAGQLGFHEF